MGNPMSESSEKNKGGRPLKTPASGKRPNVTFRCRSDLHARIQQAAQLRERSVSEEIETRLDNSFRDAQIIHATTEQTVNHIVDFMVDRETKSYGGQYGQEAAKYFGTLFSVVLKQVDAELPGEPWFRSPQKLDRIQERIADAHRTALRQAVDLARVQNETPFEFAERMGVPTAGLTLEEVQKKLAAHVDALVAQRASEKPQASN